MTAGARTLRAVEPPPEGPMATVILLLSLVLAIYLLVALWRPDAF